MKSYALETPEGPIRPHPEFLSQCGLAICISSKFPSDTDTAGLGNHTLGTTVLKEADKRDTLQGTEQSMENIFKRGSRMHATAVLI